MLFGMVVGGGAMVFAHRYHVVNTVDGVIVVPRLQTASLSTAWADVRGWDASHWQDYPDLSAAMIADGHADAMRPTVTSPTSQAPTNGPGSGSANSADGAPHQPAIIFGSPVPPESSRPAQPEPGATYPGPSTSSAAQTSSAPATAGVGQSILSRLTQQVERATTPHDVPLAERPLDRTLEPRTSADTASQPDAPPPGSARTQTSPRPEHLTASMARVVADEIDFAPLEELFSDIANPPAVAEKAPSDETNTVESSKPLSIATRGAVENWSRELVRTIVPEQPETRVDPAAAVAVMPEQTPPSTPQSTTTSNPQAAQPHPLASQVPVSMPGPGRPVDRIRPLPDSIQNRLRSLIPGRIPTTRAF